MKEDQKVIDHDAIYRVTMDRIKAEIKSQWGSVAKFSAANDMSAEHLSRAFSITSPEKMSVIQLLRVAKALGFDKCDELESKLGKRKSKLTIFEYLELKEYFGDIEELITTLTIQKDEK